ncbi:MAG TPA: glycosyltransferase [Crinalium sp.]|jgi:hopene-associated glycosyltransferase HpnB
MNAIAIGFASLSLFIWSVLLLGWGQFWRCNQQLLNDEDDIADLTTTVNFAHQPVYPSIAVVIPARNEAELLPVTLRSLLNQTYPGSLTILLVDDNSTDGTGAIARSVAQSLNKADQLIILSGKPLPSGWTGKLWAMAQGVERANRFDRLPDYVLLTDADIEHDPGNVHQLVVQAQRNQLDLVSLMVHLRCESIWEKLLIPAFVFFFQKLYPFPWVNHPTRRTAAAAGGCILICRDTLQHIGGIEAIHQALIDDCALANAVKSRNLATVGRGRIWLGLSFSTRSLRPYPSLASIWDMVARTAFTQLNYSPWLLLGTVIGMTLIYLVPAISAIAGLLTGNSWLSITGLAGWLLMAIAYFPTVRFYRCSPLFALGLPAIAFLYTLMTLDSALRHWQGRGGAWKGRTYSIGSQESEVRSQ